MKAKYRIISITLLVVSTIFLGVVYSGCVKTGCADNFCMNGALCVNSSCACVTGYEGTRCDTLWAAKFSGTWNVEESVLDSNGTQESNYKINVNPAGNAQYFLINNLEGTQDSVYCQFLSVFTFSIPAQSQQDSSFYIIDGAGAFDPSTGIVRMEYNFVQNGLGKNSQMHWTR